MSIRRQPLFKRTLLATNLLVAFMAYNSAAVADPVILPAPEPFDAPPVFCFKVTGGDVLPSGGARFQFEILNWTGEDAYYLQVNQSDDPTVNTGGLLDPDAATTTAANGWVVDTNFDASGVIYSAFSDGGYGGPSLAAAAVAPDTPLPGIDLDPANDLTFSAYPGAVPSPVDSGINVLDGFILEFPDFDPYERVVLQWDLLNGGFQSVDSFPFKNPFSFGTFQIDRGADGSVRVVTGFSVGTSLSDVVTGPPPVDPALTDLNAITLAPTAIPVPATVWLMLSGLAAFFGFSKKGRRT